jgi:hypothetical protein
VERKFVVKIDLWGQIIGAADSFDGMCCPGHGRGWVGIGGGHGSRGGHGSVPPATARPPGALGASSRGKGAGRMACRCSRSDSGTVVECKGLMCHMQCTRGHHREREPELSHAANEGHCREQGGELYIDSIGVTLRSSSLPATAKRRRGAQSFLSEASAGPEDSRLRHKVPCSGRQCGTIL